MGYVGPISEDILYHRADDVENFALISFPLSSFKRCFFFDYILLKV